MKKFKKFELKKQIKVIGGDSWQGLGLVQTNWIGATGEGTDTLDERDGSIWYD